MPYRDPRTGRFSKRPARNWMQYLPVIAAGAGSAGYTWLTKKAQTAAIKKAEQMGFRTIAAGASPKTKKKKQKPKTALMKSEHYGKALGKYAYSKRTKISRKAKSRTLTGIQFTKETVGTASSFLSDQSNPAYVGHYTMPFNVVMKHVFRTLLRAIYSKKSYTINSFETVVPAEFVGDGVFIRGYENGDDITEQNIGNYVVVTGDTFEKIATAWYTSWDTARNALPNPDAAYYEHIAVDNADGSSNRFSMSGIYWNLYCKSSLKFQNRTPADSGSETDNRDNIASNPIYGKLYFGLGAAPQLKGKRAANFHGEGSSGIVLPPLGVSGVENSWEEPPQPAQLTRCTGSTKLVLAPGGIKTSVITQKLNTGFNGLVRKFSQVDGGTVASAGPGKYALVCLEKMMNETVSPNVLITYELNFFMNADCHIKVNRLTNPVVGGM